MIIIFPIIAIILLILYKQKIIKNIYLNTFIKYLLIASIISPVLELTIFSFRHYESLFYKNPETLKYTIGSGLECKNNICSITDKENAYLEITSINTKIENLYLNITSKDNLNLKYDITYNDEANQNPFKVGTRNYLSRVKNSHYIRINTSGKSTYLKINLTKANHKFTINELSINQKVPFFISNTRLIITFLITLFLFLINPKNKLQDLTYNFYHSKLITCILIIILSLFFGFLTLFNIKSYTTIPTSQYSQYKNLARSLSKGQLYLDLDVNPKLLELNNPYDTHYRDEHLQRYHDYYWDYAFYNGKYYSYFGIVPCLLTYLPYYLLTGTDLPNPAALGIGITVLIISVFLLFYELIKKYFKNTSYIYYSLISIFFIIVSGIASFAGESTFYNLPIIYAISFFCFSLRFYLKATEGPKLSKKYLFLGSLCLALIAGCRPQSLLTLIFPIIILWDYVFKKRELFSKDSLKETLCLVAPYIIIALLIMYYNYARFGSIFDFGANYNLTTNDMTKRGIKFDRTFLGLYYFLFSTVKITPIFPFIEKTKIATSFLGRTIYEDLYGGFFFINFICIISLFFFKFKKIISNKKLYAFCKYSVIIAFIIVLLDTQMAGILPRYLSDFGYLFALATTIIILSLLNKNILNKDLQQILVLFIVLSITYNLLTFFLTRNVFGSNELLTQIYYQIYYTFMFWL